VPSIKTTMIGLVLFILPGLPILIFDYIRNFEMLSIIYGMVAGNGDSASMSDNRMSYLITIYGDRLQDLWGMQFLNSWLLLGIFLIAIVYLTWKKATGWQPFHLLMLTTTALIFLVYYQFFPKNIPE